MSLTRTFPAKPVRAFGILMAVSFPLPPSIATSEAATADDVTIGSYTHPNRLVAIDGNRRLNLFCAGRGRPAVIFESGLGGGAIDWRKVQGPVGRRTQACSYDRAGYGFSDAATRPSDASNTVDDLHRLLRAASIPLPIVLVAHSIGGLYATLYATSHHDDLAGMVLVDPAFAGQDQAFRKAIGPSDYRVLTKGSDGIMAALARCVALARQGTLTKPEEAKSDCLDNPANPDPVIHRALMAESERAAYQEANQSEFENALAGPTGLSNDATEVIASHPNFRSIPVIVLTASDHPLPPTLKSTDAAAIANALRQGHRQLADLSRNGDEMLVQHSGHYIQLDQPDVVIEEIDRLLAQVRLRSDRP